MRRSPLELSWVNKAKRLAYEDATGGYRWVEHNDYRVAETRPLVETERVGDPTSGSVLVKGDNLLALRSLLVQFGRKVKCVYIDPPFNTGQAFEHYDDGLEHSVWLTLMRDRLALLKQFLRDDGAIYVHIDDAEMAYLKILLDEEFGRNNFVTTICFKAARATGVKMSHAEKKPVQMKQFILVYARNKAKFRITPQYRPIEWDGRYNQWLDRHDSDNPRKWTKKTVRTRLKELEIAGNKNAELEWKLANAEDIFRTAATDQPVFKETKGKKGFFVVKPPKGAERFAYNGEKVLFASAKFKDIGEERVLGEDVGDWWEDISHNNLHNEGGVTFPKGKKPEELIRRILRMSTSPGDWVLDSFAGSGTTGAVAHKMGRRWIMVERGDHADTLCMPRLGRVVAGKDSTGVTKAENWEGGGGFRYFALGPSLFTELPDLRVTALNPHYQNGALIDAICFADGFERLTDGAFHGRKGKVLLHVSEDFVSRPYIEALQSWLPEGFVLRVLAKRFDSDIAGDFDIRQIPDALLRRFTTESFDSPVVHATFE